jgi:hypothetical protein
MHLITRPALSFMGLLLTVLLAAAAVAPDDTPPPDPMIDTRLKLIEQGLARQMPPLPSRDALLLLAAIKERTDQFLNTAKADPVFATTLPTTLDDFEKRFWSIHVLSNQLTNAARFVDAAPGLKSSAQRAKVDDSSQLTVLKTDWAAYKAELVTLREKLAPRERELRLARLKLAEEVLTDSKDTGERLLAALALDLDAEALPQLLAKDPAQAKQVKATLDRGRTLAGANLLLKSRSLFTGLHWWLRGRYGVGVAAGGLLKDPAALDTHDGLFGLLMPIAQPVPTPPAAKDTVPLIDRRHHYLWQLETRHILASGSQLDSTTTTEITAANKQVTTLSHFY